ncbi:MAG: TIR domain-containing protein [Rhodospirillaceae bacterium]|nr:TIR domain-containing protein [Rhodospirillaceae bacterium]
MSASNPLIFISHDTRDAELAEAFSSLLKNVSAGILKSFRSSDRKGSQGIEYGVEWFPEIMNKLGSASDVVCLLTPQSVGRPWILYEAGVAKGKLDTPVYGVALGIPLSSASVGPFAQFQNCDDNEDSLTKLVIQLLEKVPNSEPDREAILLQVKTFRDRISKLLKQHNPKDETKSSKDAGGEGNAAKLFEEIKIMYQDLPSRIESRLVERPRKRTKRLFPPMLLDLLEHPALRESNGVTAILFVSALIKDDVPWATDLLNDLAKSIRNRDLAAFSAIRKELRELIELIFNSPMGGDISGDKESRFFGMEFLEILDRRLLKDIERRLRRMEQKPTAWGAMIGEDGDVKENNCKALTLRLASSLLSSFPATTSRSLSRTTPESKALRRT